jgi:hypothetical protein
MIIVRLCSRLLHESAKKREMESDHRLSCLLGMFFFFEKHSTNSHTLASMNAPLKD